MKEKKYKKRKEKRINNWNNKTLMNKCKKKINKIIKLEF